jgi:ribonuclease P protein component
MKTGHRASAAPFSVFITKEVTPETRFGFVISKAVGNAVTRNRIKRQLRAVSAELLPSLEHHDIVFRVNPSAAHISFQTLRDSMLNALAGLKR